MVELDDALDDDPGAASGRDAPWFVSLEPECFEADSEGRVVAPVTIAPGEDGVVVVPFALGGVVRPITWTSVRDAASLDLKTTYKAQNVRSEILGDGALEAVPGGQGVTFDWPLTFPYAPEFAEWAAPGDYLLTLEVAPADSVACVYATPGTQGGVLDLDVYLVGVDGVDADSAPDHPDLSDVFERAAALLAQAGITFGRVRFIDAASSAYRVLRDRQDLAEVTSLADRTLDAGLSVDVFLVRSIFVRGGSALAGFSGGLPGPPGIHGEVNAGLVLPTTSLGEDNLTLARTLAHELGHFLGLRHTTELVHNRGDDLEARVEAMLGTTDPLSDTPVCDEPTQAAQCPDVTNLMFPVLAAPAQDTLTLSPQQVRVLVTSPWVR
ncbi:MAG: M43 family zinc metalloprotease [Myxococcota bacterium]